MPVIECPSACTVTLQISLAPFDLTVEQGVAISGAILLVWAAGWAIRQILRVLNTDSGGDVVDRS